MIIKDSRETVKGLTILTAAVFIVGEMSGTGVLSLPYSINDSHWAGVVLIFGIMLNYYVQNQSINISFTDFLK